ncbi:tyrosine-type recombinase/integrase [Kribbella sp. NPDC051936]|uniref:tyrosine-type recombinase/integrase n=1 Tax=Kribbella sp. NPDC051936 TaxID=3154946 RepID=UPI00342A6EE8
MLGLLGLRIFEATASDIRDLGEQHGHRVLRVHGQGRQDRPGAASPSPGPRHRTRHRRPDRRTDPADLTRTRMDRHCATRRLRHLAEQAGARLPRMHPHMLRHTFVTTMLDAGVYLRDVRIAAPHADPRTTMRYDRARNNLDRHPTYILAAYMASAT